MIRLAVILFLITGSVSAQQAEPPVPEGEPPMTYERLGRILFALDPEKQPSGPGFEITVADVPVLVITDVVADRMRAMVPISSTADLSVEDLQRMWQKLQ